MAVPSPQLTRSLAVLSAMVTPAVLILASASLVSATATRLIHLVTSSRELSEELARRAGSDGAEEAEHDLRTLHGWIDRAASRVKLLQVALTLLQLAIAAFVLTVLSIGVSELLPLDAALAPPLFGLAGVALLLAVAVVLIVDARLGMLNSLAEMELTVRRIDARLGRLAAGV